MILTVEESRILQDFLGEKILSYFKETYSLDLAEIDSIRMRRRFAFILMKEGYNLTHLIYVAHAKTYDKLRRPTSSNQ